MKVRDAIKAMEKEGWVIDRTPGTLNSMLKKAGLK
jgi:predicted RNA binding protein YcfA (HicA-like mRNA interferase family)